MVSEYQIHLWSCLSVRAQSTTLMPSVYTYNYLLVHTAATVRFCRVTCARFTMYLLLLPFYVCTLRGSRFIPSFDHVFAVAFVCVCVTCKNIFRYFMLFYERTKHKLLLNGEY